MNDRPERDPTRSGPPVDDETLGRLVRDAAEAWAMPPQRLGTTTWRDRIGGRESRRARAGGWLRRLGVASMTAVAATVVVALVAVWLNIRPGPVAGPAVSPGPSGSERASESPGASASPDGSAGRTPLPSFAIYGAPLSQRSLPVRVASGGTALVDLATGRLSAPLSYDYADVLVPTGDGYRCVCFTRFQTGGVLTAISLSVRTFDAGGRPTASHDLGQFMGTPDPALSPDPGAVVDVSAAISPDGSRGLIGWSYVSHGAWRVGLDLVDLATGTRLDRRSLADVPITASGSAQYAWAPVASFAPDGTRVVTDRYLVTASGATSSASRAVVPIAGDRLGEPVALDAPGLGDVACASSGGEGFVAQDVYYAVCFTGARPTVRWFDVHGRQLGEVQVEATGGLPVLGSLGAVDQARGALYYWSPTAATLYRIDTATGVVGSVTLPAAAASAAAGLDGVVRALGGWLVPTVSAKTLLEPGIALSPDGTRAFVLGVTAASAGDAVTSTGIWVVDTATMKIVDHWPAVADFSSIGVSRDGSVVFVLARGLTDGQGDGGAVLAYDAATGNPRVVVGNVGTGVTFAGPLP